MLALHDFVRRRLDEDENAANRVHEASEESHPQRWRLSAWDPTDGRVVDERGRAFQLPTTAHARHVVRHDPWHVVQRCRAQRALVAMHVPVEAGGCSCAGPTRDGRCEALRLLAAQWADHVDYRSEWSVEGT